MTETDLETTPDGAIDAALRGTLGRGCVHVRIRHVVPADGPVGLAGVATTVREVVGRGTVRLRSPHEPLDGDINLDVDIDDPLAALESEPAPDATASAREAILEALAATA